MLTVKKQKDKDFVILNLSDPQLGNDEWAPEHRNFRIFDKTVKTLIDRVHPDLITISGDLSWAGHTVSYENYAVYLDKIGVPWSCVWGNHDNQGSAETVEAVVKEYLAHPLCLYERGDAAHGNGNFVIKIEEDGKPVSALIMMDSHDRMPYVKPDGTEEEAWAKLIPAQLDWYREQVEALRNEGCEDSVLLMHIPIYAYRDAFRAAFRADVDPASVKPDNSRGAAFWNEGFPSCEGVKYEDICSYPAEDGMMDVIEALGHTKHMIVGHDHVNNFIIPWRGTKLIYSLKCGAGCYWNPILNGGTVFTVGTAGVESVRHEFVDVSELL